MNEYFYERIIKGKNMKCIKSVWIDKALLSRGGSIEGAVLACQRIFCIYFASKSRGWRCDWEREVEQGTPF
jgi:hypothetical protein